MNLKNDKKMKIDLYILFHFLLELLNDLFNLVLCSPVVLRIYSNFLPTSFLN